MFQLKGLHQSFKSCSDESVRAGVRCASDEGHWAKTLTNYNEGIRSGSIEGLQNEMLVIY